MIGWQSIADRSQGQVTVDDLERTAYRLVTEQVIYAADRGSRLAYDLVVKHFSAYRDLLSALGLTLKHNHFHSYVAALPTQRVSQRMRLSETLLALVLRKLYDDKMNSADVVGGEALIPLEELEQAYKDLLKRPLPERAELKALAAALKRYGITRMEEVADDLQPFQLVVRPGIVDVLGETALHALAQHAPDVAGEEIDHEAA